MGEHSKIISGSTALRRMHCLGSADLEAAQPEEESSEYAKEGTYLHGIMEQLLDGGTGPDDLKGEVADDLLYGRIWPAYDAVCELLDRYRVRSFDLERRYELIQTAPGCYGTVDLLGEGVDEDGVEVGIVADFKFGQGIKERAEENHQLAFYGLGAIDNADPFIVGKRKLVFAIIQPWERDDTLETLDVWETDTAFMDAFQRRLKWTYDEWESGRAKGKYTAGRWCKFCRARAVCPEQNATMMQVDKTFESRPFGDMTDVELGDLLALGERCVEQFEALKKYAERRAVQGHAPAGWKVVQSLGNRTWEDPKKAEAALVSQFGSEAYTSKILSPAQAEKAAKKAGLAKDHFDQYVIRPERGVRLVRDTDKRPSVSTGRIEGADKIPALKG